MWLSDLIGIKQSARRSSLGSRKPRIRPARHRVLQLESLESRELLSVGPMLAASLDLVGTDGADVIKITGGAAGAWKVDINGLAQTIPADTTTVTVDGLGGDDKVIFNGSNLGETAKLWPDRAEFSGGGVTVTVQSIISANAHMGDGSDAVEMYGTDNVGDLEQLTATPHAAVFSGPHLSLSADGFESLVGYAGEGGQDTAFLFDSPDADYFYSDPTQAILFKDGDYINVAVGFRYAHGYATAGGFDIAEMYDSPDDDTFLYSKDLSKLFNDNFYCRAKNFEQVTAYSLSGSTPGGGDIAYLLDTVYDDVFTYTATTGLGTLETNVRQTPSGQEVDRTISAANFDYTHAYGNYGGTDIAYFYDSPDNDTLLAQSSQTKMYNFNAGETNFYVRAKTFEQVYAYATAGGDDAAELVDSPGKDWLELGHSDEDAADWVEVHTDAAQSLHYLAFAEAFDHVSAWSSNASDEAADPAAVDAAVTAGWLDQHGWL